MLCFDDFSDMRFLISHRHFNKFNLDNKKVSPLRLLSFVVNFQIQFRRKANFNRTTLTGPGLHKQIELIIVAWCLLIVNPFVLCNNRLLTWADRFCSN